MVLGVLDHLLGLDLFTCPFRDRIDINQAFLPLRKAIEEGGAAPRLLGAAPLNDGAKAGCDWPSASYLVVDLTLR